MKVAPVHQLRLGPQFLEEPCLVGDAASDAGLLLPGTGSTGGHRRQSLAASTTSLGTSPLRMRASKPRNCSMLKRRSSASSAQRQARSLPRDVHSLMKLLTTSGG